MRLKEELYELGLACLNFLKKSTSNHSKNLAENIEQIVHLELL